LVRLTETSEARVWWYPARLAFFSGHLRAWRLAERAPTACNRRGRWLAYGGGRL